jgi:hypothetical protein
MIRPSPGRQPISGRTRRRLPAVSHRIHVALRSRGVGLNSRTVCVGWWAVRGELGNGVLGFHRCRSATARSSGTGRDGMSGSAARSFPTGMARHRDRGRVGCRRRQGVANEFAALGAVVIKGPCLTICGRRERGGRRCRDVRAGGLAFAAIPGCTWTAASASRMPMQQGPIRYPPTPVNRRLAEPVNLNEAPLSSNY